MEVNKLSKTREVRLLGQLDIPAILKVCSGNTLYFQYHPPVATAESIAADMQALPPGKRPEDKYYIGFFTGNRLIAVMDLILDYPETATAFIGFLWWKLRGSMRESVPASWRKRRTICVRWGTGSCGSEWIEGIRRALHFGARMDSHRWTRDGTS